MHVFFMRYPSKIFNIVICFDSVNMVYLHIFHSVYRKKRFHDKPMDISFERFTVLA